MQQTVTNKVYEKVKYLIYAIRRVNIVVNNNMSFSVSV